MARRRRGEVFIYRPIFLRARGSPVERRYRYRRRERAGLTLLYLVGGQN